MAKPKQTVLTFGVKIELPTGSNAHEMQLYLRDAIGCWGGSLDPNDPHFNITPESFTVALQEKRVTYG